MHVEGFDMKVNKQIMMSCFSVSLLVMAVEVAIGADAFEKLTLEVRRENGPILPMEAISVMVTVSNKTDELVLGHDILDPHLFLTFYVAREGEAFERVSLSFMYPWTEMDAHLKELPPGYQYSRQLYLWYGRICDKGLPKALFPNPGDYLLKVVLTSIDGKSKIESNVIALEVAKPTARDLAAWQCLKNKELESGSFPLRTAAGGQKKTKELKEFAQQFDNSRYAVYAHYSLSMIHYVAKDLDQAIFWLKKAARDKKFILREEVLFYLGRLHLKQGKVPRARSYLSTLKREYPETSLTKTAERDMWRYTHP